MQGRGGWDGPEAAGSAQGRGRHAHVWPWAPKTSLALRRGTASERAVASWEQPHGGAGTCLPHVPVVLAPCHRFQGHLISPTEARGVLGVLVSWVLSGRLCLFLVLVPAQMSTGAKTDTSTNAPLLLIAWGAQALGLSPISSAARLISALEQEQGAQRYIQIQMGPLPVMENPSRPSKAVPVVN